MAPGAEVVMPASLDSCSVPHCLPHPLYLHKRVEAGVPQALPVCCCLKAQLVGASLDLLWCQEG